jgi:hypothetical protein
MRLIRYLLVAAAASAASFAIAAGAGLGAPSRQGEKLALPYRAAAFSNVDLQCFSLPPDTNLGLPTSVGCYRSSVLAAMRRGDMSDLKSETSVSFTRWQVIVYKGLRPVFRTERAP